MRNKRSSRTQRAEALLNELKEVASRLGIRVREEKLLREVGYRVYGGSCRLQGEEVIFLNREQPLSQRIDVLLDELMGKNLKEVPLSPTLQRLLGRKEAA